MILHRHFDLTRTLCIDKFSAMELAELYTSPPPWDIGRPQGAFLALAETGVIKGRVLDAGCGTGEHALMAAGLGLEATGVDLAANALDMATGKARNRGLEARFIQHDVLNLPDLGETFDTVIDSLVFHYFDDQERAVYIDGLRSVLRPGGRFHTLCLRDAHPGGQERPRPVEPREVEAAFTGWQVDSIEPSQIESTHHPDGLRGWRVSLTRL
jgi:SAM-dependent methyltransferase